MQKYPSNGPARVTADNKVIGRFQKEKGKGSGAGCLEAEIQVVLHEVLDGRMEYQAWLHAVFCRHLHKHLPERIAYRTHAVEAVFGEVRVMAYEVPEKI